MTFERVHTVWDYYDGPRSGIADYAGRPHFYSSEWDKDADNYADTFTLLAIDDITFELAMKQWQIWRQWESAYHRGEKEQSSHPALPGQDSTYAELESELQARIGAAATSPLRVYGVFRAPQDQRHLPKGAIRELEVEWTPCHPTTRSC